MRAKRFLSCAVALSLPYTRSLSKLLLYLFLVLCTVFVFVFFSPADNNRCRARGAEDGMQRILDRGVVGASFSILGKVLGEMLI